MRLADINGDGRVDRLTLRWQHFTERSIGRGVALLVVHLAGGPSEAIRVRVPRWIDFGTNRAAMPPVNTAQIDGVPGREVVIGVDNSPASFIYYTVITDHHGLRLLPAPVRTGWFVGSSVGPGGIGFTCHRRSLTVLESGPGHEVGPGEHGIRYRTVRSTLRWRAERWHLVMRTVTRGTFEAGWWKCPGIDGL